MLLHCHFGCQFMVELRAHSRSESRLTLDGGKHLLPQEETNTWTVFVFRGFDQLRPTPRQETKNPNGKRLGRIVTDGECHRLEWWHDQNKANKVFDSRGGLVLRLPVTRPRDPWLLFGYLELWCNLPTIIVSDTEFKPLETVSRRPCSVYESSPLNCITT